MRKLLLILTILTFQLTAQTELSKSALESFNNQEWEESIKLYKKYLKKNKTDSSAWYNLAMSQMNNGAYEDALSSFEKAKETKYSIILVSYNQGKTNALLKNETEMLKHLNVAADNGMAGFTRLQSDEAFKSYLDTEGMNEVIEKMTNNAYPCRNNENSRHFDFWIGEWDVYVNGNKVGENSITKAVGGCAIHENYTTPRIYAGQSINFYDPIDEKWHQHWVGSSGDVYNYIEVDRAPGMLQFQSDFLFGGQRSLSRLTFTKLENGDVRQLFESSTDGGKTWASSFDGTYKRKK